jgi:hypothetical protein
MTRNNSALEENAQLKTQNRRSAPAGLYRVNLQRRPDPEVLPSRKNFGDEDIATGERRASVPYAVLFYLGARCRTAPLNWEAYQRFAPAKVYAGTNLPL